MTLFSLERITPPQRGLVDQTGHIRVPPGTDTATFLKELYQKSFDPKRRVIYVGTMLPVPQYERRPVTIGGEQWEEEIYFGTVQATTGFSHRHVYFTCRSRAFRQISVLVGSPRLRMKYSIALHFSCDGATFDDVARNLRIRF